MDGEGEPVLVVDWAVIRNAAGLFVGVILTLPPLGDL